VLELMNVNSSIKDEMKSVARILIVSCFA
jgi:hypothetical protein